MKTHAGQHLQGTVRVCLCVCVGGWVEGAFILPFIPKVNCTGRDRGAELLVRTSAFSGISLQGVSG